MSSDDIDIDSIDQDGLTIDGLTWREWAAELFEFELCSECHGDVDAHEPAIILGQWFAHCTAVPCDECGDMTQPLFTSGLCPDCEPRWAVVASHEDHGDYVLTDGLTEADAREMATHEGAPFYAKPMTDVDD